MRLYPASWLHATGLAILLLVIAWGVYHAIRNQLPEQRLTPWVRLRPRQSRLITSRQTAVVQRVRVKAQADSWLRVVENRQLIFEGILPSGAAKDWSGPGPFMLKIGNVQALSVYWNDQPVDIVSGAHGAINDLQIPPNK